MEVAGQWRREWAGTAEYGKVTEGGVTRQVARAMEVLHATAPGARVRVLRAAYHSTAGPGAPASSYLLHSSRRVISSGYNFVEPDASLSKPLEISSTPLESSPDVEIEKENYKVTEPDDFEISEPSKWRSSRNINSMRMPSEESSSTDNTSVIDLDYNNKNTIRKTTEKFIPQNVFKRTSPISSLLDVPVTLSTLKYKSLLNGSDSWTNRRKSYSFEETPELDESILRRNEALTMESSTDSGICKSSEFVNDNKNLENSRYVERKVKMDDIHEETFKDWLSKNRHKSYANQLKSNKEHIISVEHHDGSNVTLQSAGKMSITLPTSTKTDDCNENKSSRVSEDGDRKTKKVEFCKTELHFAAESGTVNIIATDEKPPPSNDFRKRRSVFVPMNDSYNKSITLFGEKTDSFDIKSNETYSFKNENIVIDENTAATKSILKNKIPKPKPYLLGENMVFGDSIDSIVKDNLNTNFTKTTGVSLINKQLQSERRFSNESTSTVGSETDWRSFPKPTTRTNKIGPVHYVRSNQDTEQSKNLRIEKDINNSIQNKLKTLQLSPTTIQARTRQLRESDLTYFGIAKTGDTHNEKRKHSLDSIYDEHNAKEDMLNSVKLVKLISNSVCNSEIDSDEAPDYENLTINYNYTPKPAPRTSSKYANFLEVKKELNPILEKNLETDTIQSRRVRLKKQVVTLNNRSLSEPRKANRQKSIEKPYTIPVKTNQPNSISSLSKYSPSMKEKCQKPKIPEVKFTERKKSESPLYVNLQTKNAKKNSVEDNNCNKSVQQNDSERKTLITKGYSRHTKSPKYKNYAEDSKGTVNQIDSEKNKRNLQQSEVKKDNIRRTKVLVTPEKSPSKSSETSLIKNRNTDIRSSNDRNITNRPTHRHRSHKSDIKIDGGESQPVEASSSARNNREGEGSSVESDIKAINIKKSRYKLLGDAPRNKASLKEQQEEHKNVIADDIKTLNSKVNKTEKKNDYTKSKRSKYVINYDDKNGTVSSVCKVRPGHGSSRKKNDINYKDKENYKDNNLKKINGSNKTDLHSRTKEDFNRKFEVERHSQATLLPNTVKVKD